MSVRGYESDATYFEFLASKHQDPKVRRDLLGIARTYRLLSKTKDGYLLGSREDRWRKRAEECRTLSERFDDEFCRAKLVRLAEAYDLLSGDQQVQAF